MEIWAWICDIPWERLLLVAESVTLVIGSILTWLYRRGLMGQIRSLKDAIEA